MPILDRTEITGQVAFLGVVRDRRDKLSSDPISEARMAFEGMAGECHGGLTRPSCSRVSGLYPVGTNIRNARQISIMSVEEIAEIGKTLGAKLSPEWFGANIVFEGIPKLTDIPPSSRLVFDSGAAIIVDMENAPCVYAAKEIAKYTDIDAMAVKPASKHKRGLVGAVEAEGLVKIGDQARLFIPKSRPYVI